MALGYTLQVPEQDKYLISTEEIKNQIRILMGGRIAEDLIFNEVTSGASNDIERATALAKQYVCAYGMSKLGTRRFGKTEQQVFLGKDIGGQTADYSDATAKEIDVEINNIINTSFEEAKKILKNNLEPMKELAELLIEKEVIEGKEFLKLFEKMQKKHSKTKASDKAKKTIKKSINKIKKGPDNPGNLRFAQA